MVLMMVVVRMGGQASVLPVVVEQIVPEALFPLIHHFNQRFPLVEMEEMVIMGSSSAVAVVPDPDVEAVLDTQHLLSMGVMVVV
jgi:hypothetical protein